MNTSAFIHQTYFYIIEKILHWCFHARLRPILLRFFGAKIGKRVRIHEIDFIHLYNGFSNLEIHDDVYIGPGCLLDLTGKVIIDERATISPRCIIMTHSDPGSFNGNKLSKSYTRKVKEVFIGKDTWVGVNSTILCGITINDGAIIGACTLVNKDVTGNVVLYDKRDPIASKI